MATDFLIVRFDSEYDSHGTCSYVVKVDVCPDEVASVCVDLEGLGGVDRAYVCIVNCVGFPVDGDGRSRVACVREGCVSGSSARYTGRKDDASVFRDLEF